MKRNTSHTIKRAQRFPVILIGEGLLVGAVGGLIVLLYRIALTCAGKWLGEALAFIKGNPLRIAGWFAVLMLLAVLVGKLIKWEPMISGSGIPQVEGEILGKLNQNWLKVLPAKFAGGISLSVRRTVSWQGRSVYTAWSDERTGNITDFKQRENRRTVFDDVWGERRTGCGISRSFAGVMFALEELHKGFSTSLLISVMTASVTADYISSHIMGLDPVFRFQLEQTLPQNYYWMILVLGVIFRSDGSAL